MEHTPKICRHTNTHTHRLPELCLAQMKWHDDRIIIESEIQKKNREKEEEDCDDDDDDKKHFDTNLPCTLHSNHIQVHAYVCA